MLQLVPKESEEEEKQVSKQKAREIKKNIGILSKACDKSN